MGRIVRQPSAAFTLVAAGWPLAIAPDDSWFDSAASDGHAGRATSSVRIRITHPIVTRACNRCGELGQGLVRRPRRHRSG